MNTTQHTDKNALLDTLREAPLEFSLDQAKEIINQFPTNQPDVSSEPSASIEILNLKSILMISLPVIAAISIFHFTSSTEKVITSALTIEEAQVINQVISEDYIKDKSQTSFELEPTTAEGLSQKETKKTESIRSLNSTDTSDEKFTLEVERSNDETQKNKTTPLDKTPNTSDNLSKEVNTRKRIDWAIIETDIPNLTERQLKRLKKSLYTNLIADGLIQDKNIKVEIATNGNSIIINEEHLDGRLFDKYLKLTAIAGTGKYRKIVLNPFNIKVGDFGPGGFKGSGTGTFYSPEQKTESKPLTEKELREKAVKEEMDSRNAFASEMRLNYELIEKGKKRIRGINLKYKNGEKLHSELYSALLNDFIIQSKSDFVLIQIPGKIIIINGEILSPPLFEKYSTFLSQKKIKPGRNREIRLSQHSISAGKYKSNTFTGTTILFNKE